MQSTESHPSIPDFLKKEYPFESRFVTIRPDPESDSASHRMHYVEEGEGDLPLVCVHGNPTWSFYFRKVVQSLSDERRCIAFDHLGCGLSEKQSTFGYALADRIEQMRAFLDAIGVQKCDLVMHDWGGAIAFGFATRYPERVRTLIVTNTAAFTSETISWRINVCRTPVLGRWVNYYLNGFLRAATVMASKKRLPSTVKKGYLYPHRRLKDRESIDRFVKDIPMNPKHSSHATLRAIEEGLPVLEEHPKLFLWGLQDFCFHEGFLNRFEQSYPRSETIRYPDAGHFLFEDEAEACTGAMRNFLRNQS